jgi:uncharacterized protein YkwD
VSDRQLGGERSPSFLRLIMVMALACLAPLVTVGLVGPSAEDNDNVTAAGRTQASTSVADAQSKRTSPTAPATTATTTAPPTTAAPTTTADQADESAADSVTSATTTTAPPTTAAPTTTAAPAPPPTGRRAPTATEVVVSLVNAERASYCGPLAVDGRLTTAAQRHSDDMAAHDYFSHTSLNGATLADRARAAGFTGGTLGENIAAGQRTPQDVMAAWMGSAGHRANILNCDYTVIGVGLNQDGWYWTQVFGAGS